MNQDLIHLREILVERFNESELRNLCFDMEIDYESFREGGRADKARELIEYVKRRGRIPELVGTMKRHRPDLDVQGIALGNVQNLVLEHFDIELENSHWRRSVVPGQPYLFERESERYYCLAIFNSLADPSFDITVLNVSDRPVLLTEVGVRIVASADIWEERGGEPFVVGPVLTSDAYLLPMPNLRGRGLLGQPREVGNRVCQMCDIEIEELVSMRLDNPIYIASGAPFRYILRLNEFRDRIPNNVILHLWAQYSQGEVLSCPIHLFICDGNRGV